MRGEGMQGLGGMPGAEQKQLFIFIFLYLTDVTCVVFFSLLCTILWHFVCTK